MQQEKKSKAVADWLSHADGQKEARGQELWTQALDMKGRAVFPQIDGSGEHKG